ATFEGMQIGRDFGIAGTTFKSRAAFKRMRVGGTFAVSGSTFEGSYDWFDEMRVDGDFSAEQCTFSYSEEAAKKAGQEWGYATVSFAGSHFANFFLTESSFNRV